PATDTGAHEPNWAACCPSTLSMRCSRSIAVKAVGWWRPNGLLTSCSAPCAARYSLRNCTISDALLSYGAKEHPGGWAGVLALRVQRAVFLFAKATIGPAAFCCCSWVRACAPPRPNSPSLSRDDHPGPGATGSAPLRRALAVQGHRRTG